MEKAVKILVLENEMDAILLDGLLTEKGIPHLIRSYHDSAYGWLMAASVGMGPPGGSRGISGRYIENL